jgi:hypothetical protein
MDDACPHAGSAAAWLAVPGAFQRSGPGRLGGAAAGRRGAGAGSAAVAAGRLRLALTGTRVCPSGYFKSGKVDVQALNIEVSSKSVFIVKLIWMGGI